MADSGKHVDRGRTEDWRDVNILRPILDEDHAVGQRQGNRRIDNQFRRGLLAHGDEGRCAANVFRTCAKAFMANAASRLFRERGFENVTVGEVMKAAGLTHGAFYAHFGSKQELEAAAVAYGQGISAERARSHGATKKGRKAYADRYLSPRHRDNPGNGCTMAALGPEVARSAPEIKAAFEQGLEEILSAHGGDRKEVIFRTAAQLGGAVLARAVQDPQFSDEILKSVQQKLSR